MKLTVLDRQTKDMMDVDLVDRNRALRVLLLNEMDRAGQTDKGHDGCGSVGGTEQSSAGSSAQ